LFWKPEHERDIAGAFRADRESVEALFTGYFHFVPNRRENGMFDPGPLQLEAIEVSDSQLSQSLSAVIRRGDLEAAREILKTGINLNRVDEYDLFPLWHASDLGYTELVGELLDAGADPNFTATGGSSALQTAALHCKLGNI
jgi:ankyrin repeat protein